MDTITIGITWYIIFLLSTTLHEAAHAYSALKLGDPTAYYGGQVTLNPMPHIEREPFGMLFLPLMCIFFMQGLMGWASAPYDPKWAERFPKRAALMAAAGPAANFLLVVLAGLILLAGCYMGWFTIVGHDATLDQLVVPTSENPLFKGLITTLSLFFSLNVILFVINLMPLPPLDGSAIISLFLPTDMARNYQQAIQDPGFQLIGLIIVLITFDVVIGPVWKTSVLILSSFM